MILRVGCIINSSGFKMRATTRIRPIEIGRIRAHQPNDNHRSYLSRTSRIRRSGTVPPIPSRRAAEPPWPQRISRRRTLDRHQHTPGHKLLASTLFGHNNRHDRKGAYQRVSSVGVPATAEVDPRWRKTSREQLMVLGSGSPHDNMSDDTPTHQRPPWFLISQRNGDCEKPRRPCFTPSRAVSGGRGATRKGRQDSGARLL